MTKDERICEELLSRALRWLTLLRNRNTEEVMRAQIDLLNVTCALRTHRSG